MTERVIKTESVTVIITQPVDCFPSFFVGVFWGRKGGIYLLSWWFLLFLLGTALTQCLEFCLVRFSYEYNGIMKNVCCC